MADDDYRVLGSQRRGITAELEGVPTLHLDVGAGKTAEPVLSDQDGVPRGADTHNVDVALGGQDGGNLPRGGPVRVQHPGHGLGLAGNGVVHEIGVSLADFLLKGHGVPFCGLFVHEYTRMSGDGERANSSYRRKSVSITQPSGFRWKPE